MKDIVIAIDGHSGTGKSTTAKAVAHHLGYKYIDSGSMYRAVTLHFLKNDVNVEDGNHVNQSLRGVELDFVLNKQSSKSEITLNGKAVEHLIRGKDINEKVSKVSAIPQVRTKLVSIQQKMGRTKRLVMDGRDIGTVVFPGADLKVFMTAKIEERAKRRVLELNQKGIDSDFDEIKNNLLERDILDSKRTMGPLLRSEDAVEIDTTNLTFEEQVHKIVKLAEDIISEN